MNSPRPWVLILALAMSACGNEQSSSAESPAKEHFMAAQQKVLDQAKEAQQLATEQLEQQKKALEEAGGK